MSSKNILVVHYASPTGQLSAIVSRFVAPLRAAGEVAVHELVLRPRESYPFPWPILEFFDAFPESIYQDPPELKPFDHLADMRFDLIIIAYQVWFLAPSLPTAAFMQSPEAKRLLKDTPVVTLVACRDMWLMAQERMRAYLDTLDARLIGHVALVDEAGSVGSFLATPIWMLTGRRGPMLGGLIPRAGVAPDKIEASSRFGQRIVDVFQAGLPLDDTLFANMEAVHINTRLIAAEKAARRGFLAWGKLLRFLGPRKAWVRRPVIMLYILFLVGLIVTVLPVTALLKTLFAPLLRTRIERQKKYYGAPSGE